MFAAVPIAVLALLVTALVAGARSTSSTKPELLVAAAPFELGPVRNADERVVFQPGGGRPTVVNFFAAWCVPCREELPHLVDEAKARPGVQFIGVDVRDVRADAVRLLDEVGVTFPTGFDGRSQIANQYGVLGMPATVFIDGQGRIASVHQGPISRRDLRRQLDRLEAA